MTVQQDCEARAAERFARETANHQMTILHDDGLYRHIRFANPQSSFYWFDLVTWPGRLAFSGDGNGFVFAREQDMFGFFRGPRINPGYWEEKEQTRTKTKVYSEELLRETLQPYLDNHERNHQDAVHAFNAAAAEYDALPQAERWPSCGEYGCRHPRRPDEPTPPNRIREIIAEFDDDGQLEYEAPARELLNRLESTGIVSDTWEWQIRDWDWWFLWACHGIRWGIEQYDAHKATQQAETAVAA